jgi:peptidoglycan/xylan/chitin deacetylase (PgdA/CDA1 family)
MHTTTPSPEPEPASGKLTWLLLLIFLFPACKDNIGTARNVSDRVLARSITFKPLKTEVVKKPVQPAKKKKKIYLTFDDGPNKGTRNVLDIVKQENIPVSFFIVGEHVFASAGQSKVWDSLKAAQNVEILNHSYTHAHNRYDKFYQEPGTVVDDMKRTRDSLLPSTNIVRAPGRNSWRIDSLHFTDIRSSKLAMDSLQRAGFIVMGWDLEWHYDKKTYRVKNTADEMLKQIDSLFKKGKTRMPDNLVVLAHDQVYRSPEDSLQLSDFIQKLKLKEEYELSFVSNYPAIKKTPKDSTVPRPATQDSAPKPRIDSL